MFDKSLLQDNVGETLEQSTFGWEQNFEISRLKIPVDDQQVSVVICQVILRATMFE